MTAKERLPGLLAGTFHPVLEAFLHNEYREFWLKGGRGSGKSSFVSLALLAAMERQPQISAAVYRKVAATLRQSVYGQMRWAIDQLHQEERWTCRLSPMEMEKDTGQKILFLGADDPQKSKGLKLASGHFGLLWFEELAEFSGMEAIRTIKASVLRGGAGATFYTYNPPIHAGSWVNAEALLPPQGRLVHHSTYRDLPEAWLGRDFLLEAGALQQTNERAYRHMYLGEVTGAGGQVFDNLRVHTASNPLPREAWESLPGYFGLDFGFAVDPDAFVRCAFDARRRVLYIVDEFVAAGNSLGRLAQTLREKAGDGLITADSAEPRSIAGLREYGLRLLAARKGPDSVAHGMKWLQGLGAIHIDGQRCPRAAREFSSYEYGQDKNGGFLARYPDTNNHTIDAVRYALESQMVRRHATAPSS